MTDSRVSKDNQRGYPSYPATDLTNAPMAQSSYLLPQNLPTKDGQRRQNTKPAPARPLGKENNPKSTKIQQKIPSEPVNGGSRIINMEKVAKGKQRNEKNQRDLNKSLANLMRVPGKSPSGDEIFARHAKDVVGSTKNEFHSQSTLRNPGFSSTKGTPEQPKRDPLHIFVANEYYGEDSHFSKKGKYQQGRGGVSIVEFSKHQFKYARQDTFPNVDSRQMLTEGDVPVGRDGDLGVSFGVKCWEKQEQKEMYYPSSGPQSARERSFGPKLNSGAKIVKGMGKIVVQEQQEVLTFQNFSEGIKYKEGGVGCTTERREKKQEGEPLDWSQEKGKSDGTSGKKRIQLVKGEVIRKFTPEFLKIKRDIEKRKKSFDEMEDFLIAHDENGSFAKQLEERKRKESVVKGKSPYIIYQSQPTQPTFSTFQTQHPQLTTEDVSSPSFPSLHTLPSGSKSIYARENRILKRDIIENERDKALSKMACCGSGGGCQIF